MGVVAAQDLFKKKKSELKVFIFQSTHACFSHSLPDVSHEYPRQAFTRSTYILLLHVLLKIKGYVWLIWEGVFTALALGSPGFQNNNGMFAPRIIGK